MKLKEDLKYVKNLINFLDILKLKEDLKYVKNLINFLDILKLKEDFKYVKSLINITVKNLVVSVIEEFIKRDLRAENSTVI